MQSRGGLASAELARDRPVRLFLSGPAAGVIGGQATGTAAGYEDLITLDVGGTSSDIALVSGAKPLLRAEGVIDGFPVRVPMVDVNAIGAGGGSIAWLDEAGGLRVGPHSAASDPGPACYARGGREPTVTDASVVLGFLDPEKFAGGAVRLDPTRAVDAIRSRIAEPLGLDVEDAAAGIHRVVNAQMAEGIRLVSVRQGFDPREFVLVAMGGAGPLHACELAADLGIVRVVVPRHPGVLSAAGLLAAPIEHEVSVAYGEPFAGLSMGPVRGIVAELDAAGRELTVREGMDPDDIEILHFADVCHVGQGYFLEVPFDPGADDGIERLHADFLATHERVHGHAVEAPARFVNLRSVHRQRIAATAVASATGTMDTPEHARSATSPDAPSTPTLATAATVRAGRVSDSRRAVRFPDEPGRIETRIVSRETLVSGDRLRGPAIVEQDDTTTLVPPGWSAVSGDGGVMILSPDPDPSAQEHRP